MSISFFEIINVVPGLEIFFWIAASVTDAAAVNPNGTKQILANGVSTFFINGKPTFLNEARKLNNRPSWRIIFPVLPFHKIAFIFYRPG